MFSPRFISIWICNICTGRRTLALKADGPQRRQNMITRREKHALFASAYDYRKVYIGQVYRAYTPEAFDSTR